MKKVVYFLFVLLSMALVSCDESTTEPDDSTATTGSIVITSAPSGAAIWINGANINKVTPTTLTDQQPGQITISLFLAGYKDTVVTTNIVAGKQVSMNINLTAANLSEYNNVTIYESDDPSTSHPSGLDLSAGTALSIANSSGNPGKANVDIYYRSNGYVVASADLSSYMTRKTYFYIGSSDNMNDHVSAPSFTTGGTGWVTSIPDLTSNYVFVYDADGHYSKLKLSSLTASPTASVKVSWKYNNEAGSRVF